MEEEKIISMVSEIRLVKQAAGGQVATKCFWHKNIKIPFFAWQQKYYAKIKFCEKEL